MWLLAIIHEKWLTLCAIRIETIFAATSSSWKWFIKLLYSRNKWTFLAHEREREQKAFLTDIYEIHHVILFESHILKLDLDTLTTKKKHHQSLWNVFYFDSADVKNYTEMRVWARKRTKKSVRESKWTCFCLFTSQKWLWIVIWVLRTRQNHSYKKLFTPSVVQAFVNKRVGTLNIVWRREKWANIRWKSQTRLFSINYKLSDHWEMAEKWLNRGEFAQYKMPTKNSKDEKFVIKCRPELKWNESTKSMNMSIEHEIWCALLPLSHFSVSLWSVFLLFSCVARVIIILLLLGDCKNSI